MRLSQLAVCGLILAALWFVKSQLTRARSAQRPAAAPPAAAMPFRAGSARRWLQEESGQLHRVVLSADESP